MRGSPVNQSRVVLQTLNRIGTSRHEAKQKARSNGGQQSHDMNRLLGIHSHNTMKQYQKVAIDLLRFARDSAAVRDITKVTPSIVKAFMEYKIASNVKFSTFKSYCAALNKICVGINNIDNGVRDWVDIIKEQRLNARNMLAIGSPQRAYHDPQRMINELSREDHTLVAEMQLHGGARVSEVTLIRETQLLGKNIVRLHNTKGGRLRDMQLPGAVYLKLSRQISKQGEFRVNRAVYRNTLREAALNASEQWSGTHGLRWNYAQQQMDKLQSAGMSYDAALVAVSNLIGHSRADITLWYLR